MKKVFLISVFVSTLLTCVFGQTYYYQHIETVDANGARTKGSGGMYITFTSSSCYVSDKDGYATSKSTFCPNITKTYHYKGKQNDVLTFKFDRSSECDCHSKESYFGYNGSPHYACMMALSFAGVSDEYYYFSSNYERMNKPISGGQTQVYVKSAAPGEKGSGPSQFY